VTRRIRHLAALTALAALLTPLCALACLDESPPQPAGAASADPPCHREGTPAPSPEPPCHGEDCHCRSAMNAVAIDGGGPSAVSLSQPTHLAQDPGLAPRSPERIAARRGPLASATPLPAPDLLTLHATLLI